MSHCPTSPPHGGTATHWQGAPTGPRDSPTQVVPCGWHTDRSARSPCPCQGRCVLSSPGCASCPAQTVNLVDWRSGDDRSHRRMRLSSVPCRPSAPRSAPRHGSDPDQGVKGCGKTATARQCAASEVLLDADPEAQRRDRLNDPVSPTLIICVHRMLIQQWDDDQQPKTISSQWTLGSASSETTIAAASAALSRGLGDRGDLNRDVSQPRKAKVLQHRAIRVLRQRLDLGQNG